MSEQSGGWEFIAGLLIGAIAGSVAALLLAPQPGEDTRKLLQDRSIELKEKAIDLTAQARERAEHLQDQARHVIEEQKVKLEHAIEEGKEAASKVQSELLGKLESDVAES